MVHIHLDPLGGIAGDMFAAALASAYPEHAPAALRAAAALAGVPCRLIAHDDGTLTGLRFEVSAGEALHAHVHWSTIRRRIETADLPAAVRAHAIGIFAGLAEAEAEVHGTEVDRVTFHEVGARDSIADIVAAASFIDAIGPARWSVGALPLGGGRVASAHGPLPIPAPATAILLRGFTVFDDGIAGERVTPTGAAILRHIECTGRPAGRLGRTGIGFGTQKLAGISNCLRAMAIDSTDAAAHGVHRALGVITFEVDDQSGEELAAGLDRLRGLAGVHDVMQIAAYGKKGRLAMQVQLLVQPAAMEAAIEACFRETTTIGLRTHIVEARALPRHFAAVRVDGQDVGVKLVERPGGMTGKADSDHLLSFSSHAARTRARREAERRALED